MSVTPAQLAFELDDAPLPARREARAPSFGVHLAVLTAMAVLGAPAAYLLREGQVLAGTLLLGVPFTVVCVVQPFIGLCILFAISPLDSMYNLGIPHFSGTKALAIPIALGFLIHLSLRPEVRFRIPREMKVLWPLAVWGLMSAAWSLYAFHTLLSSTSILTLSTFMVLVVGMVRTEGHLKQLAYYILLGCLLLGTVGMFWSQRVASAERLTFSEVNPNNFGRALAFGMFAAIFLAGKARGFPAKLALGTAAAFLLVAIGGTQGRGTYISLAVAVLAALLVTYRRKPVKILIGLSVATIMVLFVVFLMFNYFLTPEAVTRLKDPASGMEARLVFWRAGVEAARHRLLLGWGFGTFPMSSGTMRDPHNNYILLLVELGIPGLVLWLIALAMLVFKALRAPVGSASFLMVALTTIIIFSGLTMSDLMGKTVWFEMGVLLALHQIIRSQREEQQWVLAEEPAFAPAYGP